ncbi:MAG: hypothetical protein IH840_00070 [Candidatus Heimdallarchaeota archaeon]|nr:hypothetical protein [Candidatus Heimdallarchaeota archaeon]
MTTSSFTSSIVGLAFGSSLRSDAITTAEAYFGTASTSDESEQLATAMLAAAILLNQRQTEKGMTDSTVAVLNIDQLVTPEMERLLNKSRASTFFSIIGTQQIASHLHWSNP